MSAPRVRLDAGTRHVLAWCSSCPPWRDLAGDLGAAHLRAAEHLERVHGSGTDNAALTARARAKEHRRRARESRGG